jgi:hypothetical protein
MTVPIVLLNRSLFPDPLVRELAERLIPPNIGPRPITLTVNELIGGCIYGRMSMLKRTIRCDVGAAHHFPLVDVRFGVGLGRLETREEALVALLAHEFRHMTQFMRGYRIKNQAAEIDCDRIGAACVASYRRGWQDFPDLTLPPAPAARHLGVLDYAYC